MFSSLTSCRLLVGAPYEMNGPYQTGDVYKCSINRRNNGCSKLNLGTHTSQTTAQFFPELQHIQRTLTMGIKTHPRLSVNMVV